jgi:hypothetical protein
MKRNPNHAFVLSSWIVVNPKVCLSRAILTHDDAWRREGVAMVRNRTAAGIRLAETVSHGNRRRTAATSTVPRMRQKTFAARIIAPPSWHNHERRGLHAVIERLRMNRFHLPQFFLYRQPCPIALPPFMPNDGANADTQREGQVLLPHAEHSTKPQHALAKDKLQGESRTCS